MGLLLRPRFKAVPVEGEALFLFGDRQSRILEGVVFGDLLPLLDGTRDAEEIADALEGKHERALVHYALNILTDRDAAIEVDREALEASAAFWDAMGFDPATAGDRLARAEVEIIALDAEIPDGLAEAIAATGISLATGSGHDRPKLSIVLAKDYLDPRIRGLAAQFRQAERSWMIAANSGAEIWLGPVFSPETACFECLATRLQSNRAVELYATERSPAERVRVAQAVGPRGALAAGLVALELAKWALGDAAPQLQVTVLDLRTLSTTHHVPQARPQCRLCGNPRLREEELARAVELRDDETPEWTELEDLLRFVDPVVGIVTELFPVSASGSSLHFYSALFGFGRGARDLGALKSSLLSQAAGVGTRAEDAQIGAICEALERYSGMYHGDEPFIGRALADLPGDLAIHPNDIMLYSARQYAGRAAINARNEQFNLVPREFEIEAEREWTGLWSLTERRFKVVPTALLYYHFPQPPEGASCWADSNGCAAGKTLSDAVRRGLLELIERDGVAIWWYNRLRRPAVDLVSFGYRYFDDLMAEYAGVGREVWVLDLTSDIPVPTFAAVSRSANGPEDIVFGFGSHHDAGTAIERALCEMNHLLPAVLAENRTDDDDYPYPDEAHKRWWKESTVATESYLLPSNELPRRTAVDYPPAGAQSDAAHVQAICEMLQAKGLEVLVLNQTQPDVGIPVAKVLVPGLRHFWARFAPGRLYDVPVRLGWLRQPTAETDLNPIPMFV